MGARGRLCISLWRLFECVRVRVTLNQENGWAHLPKPCFQLDGPTISKIKLLRLVFACFSPCIQKHRTLVRCFCCVSFLSTHFVLSVKYRCRTRPGPRAAGRRVCAVRVFWPQAKPRRRRNSLPPSILKSPGIQKETPANRLVFLFGGATQI